MINELTRLARVPDAELEGLATGSPARALLASIVTGDAAPDHDARYRRRVRRLVLGVAAALVVTAGAVAGPALLANRAGGATSYASAAIDIKREGGFFVARIKDPLADHARYAEGFRAVGKDVDIELVPVSPRQVGQLISSGSSGTGLGGSTVMTDLVSNGPERVDCALDPTRCTIVIRVSVDSTGSIRFKIGRAAQPGESYQDCPPPTGCPARPGPAVSTGSSDGSSAGGGK